MRLGTLVFAVSYIVARVLLELPLGHNARFAIALIPVLPFCLWIYELVKWARSLDELQRRMHLEAVAVAFPLATMVFMTLGLIEKAVGLNAQDWSYRHTWVFLPILYFAGLAFARRRYE
jgi:hypothetical protein